MQAQHGAEDILNEIKLRQNILREIKLWQNIILREIKLRQNIYCRRSSWGRTYTQGDQVDADRTYTYWNRSNSGGICTKGDQVEAEHTLKEIKLWHNMYRGESSWDRTYTQGDQVEAGEHWFVWEFSNIPQSEHCDWLIIWLRSKLRHKTENCTLGIVVCYRYCMHVWPQLKTYTQPILVHWNSDQCSETVWTSAKSTGKKNMKLKSPVASFLVLYG